MTGAAQAKTWSVEKSVIPAPHDQRTCSQLGFIPTRIREQAPDTDAIGRSVVRILSYRVGESRPRKAGTAVVISPDTLITAAHNVFDPTNSGFGGRRQGYASSVQVSSAIMPVPSASTTRFVAPPGCTLDGDKGADMAVLRLDAPLTDAIALPMRALTEQQLLQGDVVVYGFPELAPQLYLSRGSCIAVRSGLLFHTADTAEGQSGGPFLVASQGGLLLAGLHRAGPAETPTEVPPSCGAVRLVDDAIDWIMQMEGRL